MVVIEGPRFSSKAESRMFKMWGGDIIGMTAVPEVVLANEAGLCYASISMVTDYDCWRDDHDPVGFYGSASLMLLLCLKLSSPFKRLLFLRSKRFWYCVTPILYFSSPRKGTILSLPHGSPYFSPQFFFGISTLEWSWAKGKMHHFSIFDLEGCGGSKLLIYFCSWLQVPPILHIILCQLSQIIQYFSCIMPKPSAFDTPTF